jgi:hypothetical protein
VAAIALADTARLVASLELQDKFSATAAKYEKTLGAMERRTSTAERVGFQIGQGARNTINNLRTIGVVAAGAIAFNVAAGIRSLGELATVQNQTTAAIESTGGAANVTADYIREQAEAMEDLTTIDDKAIQAGQNMLLTFTNIRNEVGEGNDIFDQATEAVLDLSAAMGTEPRNAALQLGKALNDPVRGLTALRRVGIQFTEQQEEQINKMVESGRTLEAQKVIIAELNKEFGGSAAAFGQGPAATMRRFGDAVEGAQQALATGFLPVMEKLSVLVQDALGDPQVQRNITAFGTGLAEGVEGLIDVAMGLPWQQIGAAGQALGTGAKFLLDAFLGLPPWVQTAVLTGWGLNKLTGGALGGIAKTLTGAAFGQRGATPANPVFTREVGLGGGGPGGAPLGGAGRLGGLLRLGGMVAAPVGAGLALAEVVRSVEDVDAKIGHNLFDILAEQKEANHLASAFSSSTTGRWSKEQKEAYAQLNATQRVAERVNVLIPQLGRVNSALATANRALADGNQRQRELAQGIREARDRIGTGFARSNQQLGVIASKDFTPNVNVNVNTNTSVSINDVIRATNTYNVATSIGSQLRKGFTPT